MTHAETCQSIVNVALQIHGAVIGQAKSLRTKGHTALTQALTAARRESGLTQQELAERLGRSQSFVAKIELGERRVEVVELVEIARILGVPTARLIAPVEEVLGR